MAALNSFGRRTLLNTILSRNSRSSYRLISTSGNKKEAETCPPPEALYKKVPDFSKPLENKNWVSFGYSHTDEMKDKYLMHLYYFCTVTLIIGGIAFIYAFYPDKHRKHWARREAYIRLHEREQLGLEPIDPNYVDPSKITLPPDEELSDEDIII